MGSNDAAEIAFYNAWITRLVGDYVRANPRAESAISFAVSNIPADAVEILDVGCGIGWSSFELARQHRDATVLGVDLSPMLISTAVTLFEGEPRLSFDDADFVRHDLGDRRFDAVVLLDVYEHFPLDLRAAVNRRLGEILKDDGRIILTTPTVQHQEFLRTHHPDRLQPTDEDVTTDDLRRLANDVGGRVVASDVVSIWRRDDYTQTVIERGHRVASDTSPKNEERDRRIDRVRQRLGLRWTNAAGLVSARGHARVCVAKTWTISETFIREHIEWLPADVRILGARAYRDDSGCSLLSAGLARPARLLARTLRRSPDGAEDALFERLPAWARRSFYRRYLRRERIDVVLAEYGPTAAELYRACVSEKVPLVTHFHGYDAFRAPVLAAHENDYRSIFSTTWPVVAVSESMERQLLRLGANPANVHHIPYGVDVDVFKPGTPTPGLVIMVGRLVPKKAPELAIQAFAHAVERTPHARLVIIGDGPLRPAIERQISDLGMTDHVHLEGSRDRSWVAATLRRASVFVQHSVVAADGDREGTPVAICEAGAAGVPVVATRHEGITDVIVDGETGLLVDEGDVVGMGAAIADLLSDPAQAQRLGRAARVRIERLYTRELAIGRLWDLIEPLADAR